MILTIHGLRLPNQLNWSHNFQRLLKKRNHLGTEKTRVRGNPCEKKDLPLPPPLLRSRPQPNPHRRKERNPAMFGTSARTHTIHGQRLQKLLNRKHLFPNHLRRKGLQPTGNHCGTESHLPGTSQPKTPTTIHRPSPKPKRPLLPYRMTPVTRRRNHRLITTPNGSSLAARNE